MIKEIPILISTPLIPPTMAGIKTMTRRLPGLESINERPNDWEFVKFEDNAKGGLNAVFKRKDSVLHTSIPCGYGRPGSWLWVRETWGVGSRPDPFDGSVDGIEFKADAKFIDDVELLPLHRHENFDYGNYDKSGWRPSIHMPKAISRIWLQVTDVRVERLQDISEEDAVAEGSTPRSHRCGGFGYYEAGGDIHDCVCQSWERDASVMGFKDLWCEINSADSWQVNPWVWVVTFNLLSTTGKPDLNNL